MNRWIGIAAVALVSLFAVPNAVAAVYHVSSSDGDDADDGLSPETAWKTIARLNRGAIEPGDSVLLKRGDMWREQLVPRSGAEGAPITYGAYGTGRKPLLLGSVERNDPGDWVRGKDNVWSTKEPEPVGDEILPNPSFSDGHASWNMHHEGGAVARGAVDTDDFDTAPASYAVTCEQAGENGSHIQLYVVPFSIQQGKLYRLTFRAKASETLAVRTPHLMSAGPPWTSYCRAPIQPKIEIGAEWATYHRYYEATVTADDARFTFFFGDMLPAGATLHIDSCSFVECDGNTLLPCDVGNIIFDGEKSCGVKVWEEPDLDVPGEYWYDEARNVVTLCCTDNPAVVHPDIECALRRHIIDQSGRAYVTYENLCLMYGAAHGIGGGSTHHIIVRDCDLGYIGGGDQSGGDHTVRYGNGIEFWGAAHDSLVERCRLWEIYDAALTNQSSGPKTDHYNITYRNNVIWNSEYSFEYWNRPEASETYNVRFEGNTCINAGHGWGHTQRPDPSGRQLCFYTSPAVLRDMTIRDNIFYEATKNAFYAPAWPREAIDALDMDGNAWHQAEGAMISFQSGPYSMAEFAKYQAEYGKEPNSTVTAPTFLDIAQRDFRLAEDSTCRDIGADSALLDCRDTLGLATGP
ncbi:MAG TPA: carbohydrate binding domain-containing protein [Candidatus Hydrogenedentes bacterium]|nr:carbohydrate binding domain-containing protein [Candidatus Hydrogenedentota bacterium]HPG66070.1 carbohydrate binding domain-containing protein [Candidatus Hydrogenedentota bacterium]